MPVVWASGSAAGPFLDLFVSLVYITTPCSLSSAFFSVLGCSINILAMLACPSAYPEHRRQIIKDTDKSVPPVLLWRAYCAHQEMDAWNSSLEWKVKHRKEIEWWTQLSGSCQKSSWERYAAAASTALPGKSRAAGLCQAAGARVQFDKSLWCWAGKCLENKRIVQEGQKPKSIQRRELREWVRAG